MNTPISGGKAAPFLRDVRLWPEVAAEDTFKAERTSRAAVSPAIARGPSTRTGRARI